MNGSETTTAFAAIMLMTPVVSSAQRTRSVRGRGLVQHGQAGAAHPDALRGRGDLDRGAGQHRDGVTVSDARRGQPTGHPAGPLVHLGPGVPDGRVAARR